MQYDLTDVVLTAVLAYRLSNIFVVISFLTISTNLPAAEELY